MHLWGSWCLHRCTQGFHWLTTGFVDVSGGSRYIDDQTLGPRPNDEQFQLKPAFRLTSMLSTLLWTLMRDQKTCIGINVAGGSSYIEPKGLERTTLMNNQICKVWDQHHPTKSMVFNVAGGSGYVDGYIWFLDSSSMVEVHITSIQRAFDPSSLSSPHCVCSSDRDCFTEWQGVPTRTGRDCHRNHAAFVYNARSPKVQEQNGREGQGRIGCSYHTIALKETGHRVGEKGEEHARRCLSGQGAPWETDMKCK